MRMRYLAAALVLALGAGSAAAIATACDHEAKTAVTRTVTVDLAGAQAGLDATCAALVVAEGKLALLEALEIEAVRVVSVREPAGPVATARASLRATGTVARAVVGTAGSVLAALVRTMVHTLGTLT